MFTQRVQKPTSVRWSAVWLACLMVSGCEFDRPNFQMNSNSRPFFGIDVLPRRKTTSLVRPHAGGLATTVQSGTAGVSPVDHSPSIGRYLKQTTKWNVPNERTIVLPLTKSDPEQPIDRGPVELLP